MFGVAVEGEDGTESFVDPHRLNFSYVIDFNFTHMDPSYPVSLVHSKLGESIK